VVLRQTLRGLPDDEARAVRDQGPWMASLLAEGASDPRGCIDEYLAMCAPWGFTPEDVAVPVRVFQGTADTLVPPAWGATLARRIPEAALTTYPGGGHFIGLTRRHDVLDWLTGGHGGDDGAPPID
jgi:pimeloyl-ACP methyl ester carboxylesterase